MIADIAAYQPRRFIKEGTTLTNLTELEGIFARLSRRLGEATSLMRLTSWIEDWCEVEDAIDQTRSLRYIAMTCQTDDPAREAAYLEFVEQIDPWLKPRQFELSKALVEHPLFNELPDYYRVFQRSVQAAVALFREKNVAREKEEAKRCQAYQKLCGAMTVTLNGEELTLAQAGRWLEEPDRARRQVAFEAISERRLKDSAQLEALFDELRQLRGEIAAEADCANYRDYIFKKYQRFDYTPEDCVQFQTAIEQEVVPLARELQRQRLKKLGLECLRPWDLAVDPDQLPALRPFSTGAELQLKTGQLFAKLDQRLARAYQVMVEQGLMDLDNRKGKAPGGYQSTLAEARLPFIFMNAVGQQRDVETLLHEAGHAFHTLASRDQRLSAYRNAPIEFCEVASMTMELLGAPLLEEFYSEAETRRARRDHLEGVIKVFPWIATVDAFQHWLYTHPAHTAGERRQAWLEVSRRFGGIEDWSGYEEAEAYRWHRQLHIFEYPFYYVEYGIAQLGALQLWLKSRQDRAAAIDGYWQALALGGSRPLPELFAAAGIRFDFTAETIRPLMQAVRQELGL